MIDLYNDIFERWVKAIGEFDTIASHKEKVSVIKYAGSFRYDLKDYSQYSFPAGGQLIDENPAPELDYHTYGLDSGGLPVYVFFEHSWNKVSWEGVYNYSGNQIEYLEFCVNNQVPSGVQVIKYDNERKLSYQHFVLSERGSSYHFSKGDKGSLIDSVKKDIYAVRSYVERYLYEGERVIKTECLSISPGLDPLPSEKRYAYNDQGELLEITRYYPSSGITQVEYERKFGGA